MSVQDYENILQRLSSTFRRSEDLIGLTRSSRPDKYWRQCYVESGIFDLAQYLAPVASSLYSGSDDHLLNAELKELMTNDFDRVQDEDVKASILHYATEHRSQQVVSKSAPKVPSSEVDQLSIPTQTLSTIPPPSPPNADRSMAVYEKPYYDVFLVTQGDSNHEQIPALIAPLMIRCGYFRGLFCGPWRSSTELHNVHTLNLDVDGVSASAIREFVAMVNIQSSQAIRNHLRPIVTETPRIVIELWRLCQFVICPGIQSLVEHSIVKFMIVTTFIECYPWSKAEGVTVIQQACWRWLTYHLQEILFDKAALLGYETLKQFLLVLDLEDMKILLDDQPTTTPDRPTLMVIDEYVIVHFILSWLEFQTDVNHNEELLSLIKFSGFSKCTLRDAVVNKTIAQCVCEGIVDVPGWIKRSVPSQLAEYCYYLFWFFKNPLSIAGASDPEALTTRLMTRFYTSTFVQSQINEYVPSEPSIETNKNSKRWFLSALFNNAAPPRSPDMPTPDVPTPIKKAFVNRNEQLSKKLIIAQMKSEDQEIRAQLSRQPVMRMFHPVNGRFNYDPIDVSCDYRELMDEDPEAVNYAVPPLHLFHFKTKPSADVMIAMLNLEQQLRLSPEVQQLYAGTMDPLFVTTQVQLQVVRQFGFPDSFVRFIRGARSLYSLEDIPHEKLPHYMRFNRSSPGTLTVGDPAPDMTMLLPTGHTTPQPSLAEVKLSDYIKLLQLRSELPIGDSLSRERPLVIAAGSYT